MSEMYLGIYNRHIFIRESQLEYILKKLLKYAMNTFTLQFGRNTQELQQTRETPQLSIISGSDSGN